MENCDFSLSVTAVKAFIKLAVSDYRDIFKIYTLVKYNAQNIFMTLLHHQIPNNTALWEINHQFRK